MGRVKAADEGLEGFVDWTDPTISKLVKEREAEMSSLVARFTARMRKRASNAQGVFTPDFEGLDGKRSRRSSPKKRLRKAQW